MAHVVDFRASSRRLQRRVSSHAIRGSGEIVLFPGVRYERWDERSAAGLARVRDRIELPE